MGQILAFSGRKGSGKNTAVNFIYGMYLSALQIVKGDFRITADGKLYISDIFGDTELEGIFDINRATPAMDIFLADNLNEFVKQYSFADLLKQEVCMKIFGLSNDQCYGSDAEKNSLTHLKWEDIPGITTNLKLFNLLTEEMKKIVDSDLATNDPKFMITYHEAGLMTAREVMQYVGTNIFRRIHNNVWVDALMRRIKDENPHMALITDVRFPNEVEGVQKAGGKVIRLTRNPFPEDNHPSETALDKENFNWTKFDKILDNTGSIDEQNALVYRALREWNMLPLELEGMD